MNKRILIAIIAIIAVAGIFIAAEHFLVEDGKTDDSSKPQVEESEDKDDNSDEGNKEDKEDKEEEENMQATTEPEKKPEPEKPQNNTPQSSVTQGGRTVVSNPDSVTVMLNKKYALPTGWAPSDLVRINSNTGSAHYLRYEAAQSWERIRVDSLNSGLKINVVSSYRSEQFQVNLYNYYMSIDPSNAPSYSAYPRTSEHEMGLAIDISYDGSLHNDLQVSAIGKWMNENGWKYGWIMRYPKGKEHITGYIFEPWHYRYVGIDLATKLHNSGLTMEEYYGM